MIALLVLFLALQGGEASRPPLEFTTDVGMPVRVTDLVLPGPELEVKPVDFRASIAVRIDAVRPHGSDHRYDLEFYALDPGDHDLRDYLQRRDGTPADDLPEIRVHARSVLPEDRVLPAHPEPRPPRTALRYKTLAAAVAALWIAGLLAILFARRRRIFEETKVEQRVQTLAERLRPLVQAAADGSLPRERLAELEMSLLAFWRRRLGLDDRPAQEAHAALREHPEAGPLLQGLESWLHRPDAADKPDVAALLAPYRDLPADALDEDAGRTERDARTGAQLVGGD